MVDIRGQWLRNIPGISSEGDIRIPYAASFVLREWFQWGIERENYTLDRHGRIAVVMLSAIKCFFDGLLIRETIFSFSEKRVCVWAGRQEASWIVTVCWFLGGPVTDGIGREIGMCSASTPPNFCEVVVRGRFLILQRIASTLTNFYEVIVRERFWDWNCSFNTASFGWGCCSKDVLFWCIRRVT